MYARSPIKPINNPSNEKKKSVPKRTGISLLRAASNPKRPSPFREKITSISSEPVNKMPIKAAGNQAMTISIALRNTCPYKTLFSVNPFARAVITYCWFI